jgi:uncharacterized protein YukE
MDLQYIPPEQLDSLGSQYTEKAGRCHEIANFLNSPLGSLFWQSQSASRFRDNMEKDVAVLRAYEQDFTKLSGDLHMISEKVRQSENR